MFQAWTQKQEKLQAAQQEQHLLRQCGHLEETLSAQEAGLPSLVSPGPLPSQVAWSFL